MPSPEFRRDPLSDHWVIIAPDRARRPEQLAKDAGDRVPSRCPFCRGHETDTPDTVAAFAEDGSPTTDGAWQVRVIPNKYPAVERVGPAAAQQDFYERRTGFGVHEVIIESPQHLVSLTDVSELQARLVFLAYRDRLRQLRGDSRLAYAQVFKNCGEAAGASLEHTHSQLIATPVVPTQVQRELDLSAAYFRQHGRCVLCAMLELELAAESRLVACSANFVAFCPFASQFPYEVWVMPRKHTSHFEDTEPGETGEFAALVRDVVGRTESALSQPAFNYLIHTAPFDTAALKHYHWHLEFSPRLVKTAGFEWGAGDYINIVSPEDAARLLRQDA